MRDTIHVKLTFGGVVPNPEFSTARSWDPFSDDMSLQGFKYQSEGLVAYVTACRAKMTPLALGRCPNDGRILAGVYWLPQTVMSLNSWIEDEPLLWLEAQRALWVVEPGGERRRIDAGWRDSSPSVMSLDEDYRSQMASCPKCRSDWHIDDDLTKTLRSRPDGRAAEIALVRAEPGPPEVFHYNPTTVPPDGV